jgi:hypothetical protein
MKKNLNNNCSMSVLGVQQLELFIRSLRENITNEDVCFVIGRK